MLRRPIGRAVWLASVILVSQVTAAHALIFDPVRADELARVPAAKNKRVLWVRDCGSLERDDPRHCIEGKNDQFDSGDGDALDVYLGANPRYDEVWLFSGGGVSDEGFRVGRVLRKWQLTVRIPPGASCASACTVAFMGGYFRYIEEGGAYKVHSASAWLSGFDCPSGSDCKSKTFLQKLLAQPQAELIGFAEQELARARYSANRRLIHFQNALLQPLGQRVPEGDQVDRQIMQRAGARNNRASNYAGSAQLQIDARRLHSEGAGTAQDILMRIERDSMTQAIQELRDQISAFGRRADSALRMIEVMFQTSILETSLLSAETLLRMGFVTRDVVPAQ